MPYSFLPRERPAGRGLGVGAPASVEGAGLGSGELLGAAGLGSGDGGVVLGSGELPGAGALGPPDRAGGVVASNKYAMKPPPSSGTRKFFTLSMRVTVPFERFMIARPFLGMSSGFFFSFFAFVNSALVGSTPNTTNRLSAVKTGRSKRACSA